MRRITPLLLAVILSASGSLWAQTNSLRDKLWGSVELSVAPSIVDVNYSYNDLESDSYTKTTLGVNVFGGICISPKLSIGVGSGISYFDGPRFFYTPFLGEVKYASPFKQRDNVGWFAYVRGGYPIILGRNKGDGVIGGIGIGVTFGDSQKMNYNVSIGYSGTQLDYTTNSKRGQTPSRHAIELRFGLFL